MVSRNNVRSEEVIRHVCIPTAAGPAATARERAWMGGLAALANATVPPELLVRWAAMVLMLTATMIEAAAQEVGLSREYTIKAGVIGVLCRCVSWPAKVAPSPDRPLTIGILGKDPFLENGVNQLDQMVAEQNRKGNNVQVKRFATIGGYEPCHVLFVSSGDSQPDDQELGTKIDAMQRLITGGSVLVIGESSGLANRGVVANLVYDRASNLIRLEINPDAAARGQLKLAPDLLRLNLVQIVRDQRR